MPRRFHAASTSKSAVRAHLVPVRILIVSDVRLYRDALALRLNQDIRFSVVGTTEHHGAKADVERCAPDLALLDVCDLQHLGLARELVILQPALSIVALAVPEVAGKAIAATVHGIAGFVPRSGSIDDVIAVIERLTTGPDAVARAVSLVPSPGELNGQAINGQSEVAVADLTPREAEIAQMIELGLSNKEIARDLRIEVGTVKNHVHNILDKLQVRRRHQAAHRIRARLATL